MKSAIDLEAYKAASQEAQKLAPPAPVARPIAVGEVKPLSEKGVKLLEKGLYGDARRKGVPFRSYLNDLMAKEAGEDIVLSADGQFAEGGDAIQRALKAFDLSRNSQVQKFFTNANSAVLFPAVLETFVYEGLIAGSQVPNFIAGTTDIGFGNTTYTGVRSNEAQADRQMGIISPGAKLPETELTTADETIKLKKFGRDLRVTYETIAAQTIDYVGVFMRRMGLQMGVDETNEALRVIIGGDGNTLTGAITDTNVAATWATASNRVFDDMMALLLAFGAGYQMTTLIADDTRLRQLYTISEFRDPLAGFNLQATGNFNSGSNPLGAQVIRWADATGFYNSTTAVPEWIVAIDRRFALYEITAGGVLSESDNLIDKQLKSTTFSKWVGFKVIDPSARAALDTVP